MVADRLTKTVLRRFRELGLPPSLIDVDEFRDRFLLQGWVMFVRDGDDDADVHLVQPRRRKDSPNRARARRR